MKFTTLPPTPLEVVESVDMLRILEHGYDVKMVLTDCECWSVDTEEDLRRVEKLMNGDRLVSVYGRSMLKR